MNSTPPIHQSMSKVRRTLMADQAYDAIRESIGQGRFPPGAQLIEAHLADALGISRGPVREGLKRLRQEGLVVHLPHQGTFVRRLTGADMINIYDVRVALESVAIRRLARQGEVPPELAAIVEQMQVEARAGRISEMIGLGYTFHRTLCASSGNPLLVEFFDLMSIQARLALEFDTIEYLRRSDPSDYIDAHAKLLTVIEQGDEPAAGAALEHHVLDGIKLLINRLAGDGWDGGYGSAVSDGGDRAQRISVLTGL